MFALGNCVGLEIWETVIDCRRVCARGWLVVCVWLGGIFVRYTCAIRRGIRYLYMFVLYGHVVSVCCLEGVFFSRFYLLILEFSGVFYLSTNKLI